MKKYIPNLFTLIVIFALCVIFIHTATPFLGTANPVAPVLPLSIPASVRPTPTGSSVFVHDTGNPTTNGTNLQNTYNAVTCGQQVILDDGITYSGNFVFNKQCTNPNWVFLEGTGCSGGTTPIPTYLTPTTINNNAISPPIAPPALTHYAILSSPNGAAPLVTTNSSNIPGNYNYFGCLEITSTVSQNFLVGTTNALTETLASQFGDHLMFDRLYLHGIPSSNTVQMLKGFLIAASNISVINSYVSNIYSSFGDAQAILMAYAPGPYLIQNNFLSASTEIIMSGGTGKTPGYNCTIAASPAPTTTTATANTCLDANSGMVGTPAIGTNVMFITSAGSPAYLPTDWTTITGNSAGALTFNAIHAPPLAGALKAVWGLVPTDITITRNYLWKNPCWNPSDPCYDGITRSSKNFIEDKYGVRWNITANAMINTWNNGQNFAFNINVNDQNGDCPWCYSSDVTLANNIMENISGEFVIIPSQSFSGPCPGYLKRVLIQNNLFWPSGVSPHIVTGGTIFEFAGYTGCGLNGGGADSIQIIHNHLMGVNINMQLAGGIPYNYTNLVIKDNLTEFDQYRYTNQCPDSPSFLDGINCINGDVSTSLTYDILGNNIINSGAINGGQGISDTQINARYGAMIYSVLVDTANQMNYTGAGFVNYPAINIDYNNFALSVGSVFHNHASDGTDPGVNFTTLNAAIGGGGGGSTGGTVINGQVKINNAIIH